MKSNLQKPSSLVAIPALVLLGTFALGQVVFMNDDPTVKVDFEKAVAELQAQWKSNKIVAAEIMHIPTNIVSHANFSSARLNKTCRYRLLIVDAQDSKLCSSLVQTIGGLTATNSGARANLYWGCNFLDSDGRTTFSIYFDATGRKGVVNGACVDYGSDDLQKWAEAKLALSFR